MKIDKSKIKELSDYLDEFNLTEIEITEKDTKIKVSKNNVSVSNQPVTTSTNIHAINENISEKQM
jgi:acetyl-CoA carboxylase biotin carboxyl carrier protein